ncbi:MAG: ribonuclease P protein component [Synechocystis sp.]|nr:ribonuclease P protein component [Synechocystis sp.]
MGLPTSLRLKHWQDFQTVYQQGKRFRRSHLLLRVLKDNKRPTSRFGITVSQKVSKKATDRNRIKRQIRAAILTLYPQIEPGFDVVIIVLPQGIGCKYERFLRELEQLFSQAGIIHHGNSRNDLL